MMYSTKLILLVYFTNVSDEKNIKINIDAEDLLKLLGRIMNSNVFENSPRAAKRSKAQCDSYHNPYHPEDDIVSNIDDTIITRENNKKTEIIAKRNKEDTVKKNAEIDVNIEKENENFESGGNNKVSDDELTDSQTVDNQNSNSTESNIPLRSNKMIGDNNHNRKAKVTQNEDAKTLVFDNDKFKSLQRRFVLKNSR